MISSDSNVEKASGRCVRIRVLHVDDDPILLEMTKIFLKRMLNEMDVEFDITSVLSAEEALILLQNEQFDAIISDYSMPDMDGITFFEEVKKIKGENIPFIIFSAFSDEVEKVAVERGAVACIPKNQDMLSQFRRLAHVILSHVRKQK